MSTTTRAPGRAIGTPLDRIEGPQKVTGTARFAYEHHVEYPLYLYPLQSEIARGRVTRVDASAAEALPGVVIVITHENAPRLADTGDKELAILQSDEVAFRGQYIGAVIAETFEVARHAAGLVRVVYDEEPHDVELRPDRDDLYAPDQLNAGFQTDTEEGDVDEAFSSAAVKLDETYTTPMEHNNPMEPHTTVAVWEGGDLTLYDSTQGVHAVRRTVARIFGLDRDRVRVVAPHVGGGFGSKGLPHANTILAALAAQMIEGRPVKFALTRQQMFSGVGYRTPTIQRIRLGADEDGRLTATSHDVIEQSAKIKEFAEQTAYATRTMYATENRRTSHRLAALDVPVPSWMRAPGEAPGMYALEAAMDEMAARCNLDPIEFRIRNEPEVDAETGLPYSSRNLVACLRKGAERFGWEGRDPTPRVRQEGRWLVGTGVAAGMYPVFRMPGSRVRISSLGDGRYAVEIGAADIGTGTWTALSQIAADALGVGVGTIELRIGDTNLPSASVAGGSSGITVWGSTIFEAVRVFRERHGEDPSEGDTVEAGTPDNLETENYSMHAFGAYFAEARVNEDTGEVRVPRMTGVFAVGNVINAKTARSQFIGGMTMGLSMALHEESMVDERFGHVVNHDFAEYHIPTNADVGEIDVSWIDEDDPYVNPMGSKGIGEIGIVGSPAAVANAVYHATGIRVRDLPITPDKLLR
ncbi:MAG: xanthine dehydrogenase family protein molybdopterin-binding subunit [Actinomycetota bacterium]|nr:xanthine dehydrogenase family protein molybdopterin-binding subunit [Rubrobacteraceae bacterium]MBA3701879.1 xanthine dehydrogenase family protein molybdopterin-binding subunit [Rubrobacteraceae bacterium]MDQ3497689.1 xanthine dehydrogenase family protein molybdopterin-binding subunit [Actinomycetota bacterium]